jgi:ABC-2 type transport system permease protein
MGRGAAAGSSLDTGAPGCGRGRGRRVGAAAVVGLVARRELNAKLRTRSFVVGTGVAVVVLAGFVLMQSTLFSGSATTLVGLNGQAISVADQVTQAGRQLGRDFRTKDITDLAAGQAMVADGQLDALVSGSPSALSVLVKRDLNQDLRVALDAIVQQQVLKAELAAIEDVDANQVLDTVGTAHVGVQTLQPPDPQRGQRRTLALLIIALISVSLGLYGTIIARDVLEEKAGRVVEPLLAVVRPGQLLAGKVIGLGAVGLIQLAVIGLAGVVLAVATGALTGVGAVLWGLLWYLLGFWLYSMVFAVAAALVSRRELAQRVLVPAGLVLLVALVLGFWVVVPDAAGATSTVLSLIPPFTPVLMPGKIALGAAPGWQVGTGIGLTVFVIAMFALVGGRIYRTAITS